MPHVYIVREPFGGFEKGATLTHEQAHADPSRHHDQHLIRVWRPDPEPAKAAPIEAPKASPEPATFLARSKPSDPPAPPPAAA
jgi:hypothetical protein